MWFAACPVSAGERWVLEKHKEVPATEEEAEALAKYAALRLAASQSPSRPDLLPPHTSSPSASPQPLLSLSLTRPSSHHLPCMAGTARRSRSWWRRRSATARRRRRRLRGGGPLRMRELGRMWPCAAVPCFSVLSLCSVLCSVLQRPLSRASRVWLLVLTRVWVAVTRLTTELWTSLSCACVCVYYVCRGPERDLRNTMRNRDHEKKSRFAEHARQWPSVCARASRLAREF